MKKIIIFLTTLLTLFLSSCDFNMPLSFNSIPPDDRIIGLWKSGSDTYEVLPNGKILLKDGTQFKIYYTTIYDSKGKIDFLSFNVENKYSLIKYEVISKEMINIETVDPDFFTKYRKEGCEFKTDSDLRDFVKTNMRFSNFYKADSKSTLIKIIGNSKQISSTEIKGGENYNKASEIYIDGNNDELALFYINEGISKDPQYLQMKAKYHCLKSSILHFLSKYGESIIEADKALSYDNTLTKAYYIKGMSYCLPENYSYAIEVFNEGLNYCTKKDTSDYYFDMLEYRGRSKYMLNDFRGAIQDLTQIIRDNKGLTTDHLSLIHTLRSGALYEIDESLKARMDLHFALKLNPNNMDAKKLLQLMNIADMSDLLNGILNSSSGTSTYQLDRQPIDWDRYGNPIYGPSIREGGFGPDGKKID